MGTAANVVLGQRNSREAVGHPSATVDLKGKKIGEVFNSAFSSEVKMTRKAEPGKQSHLSHRDLAMSTDQGRFFPRGNGLILRKMSYPFCN